MDLWEFIVIIGVGFIILELFTPSMFFLNFAIAAFITAIVALFTAKIIALVIVFFILSFLSFVFLRPVILSKFKKETETGINDKYIGKKVKVIENVDENNGAISIYDERWTARTQDGSVIPVGSEALIIGNDSLIMFVKKCD